MVGLVLAGPGVWSAALPPSLPEITPAPTLEEFESLIRRQDPDA